MSEINEPVVPSAGNNPAGSNTSSNRKKWGRKKFLIAGLIVVFIITGVIGVGIAKNRVHKFRGDRSHGFTIGRIVKDLNLSEQQKKEVEKIKEEIKAKKQEKRKNREDNMSQFEQMFRGDSFDKQRALDLSKQRDADREEMKNFMIEQTAKVHAILTPDQRNKAADKMKEMREKKHRFGNKKD